MKSAIVNRDPFFTIPIIMELKPKSSRGHDLFRGRTIEALAREYARSGAVAVSVVTGSWFGGHIELLERVRAEVTLPILRKDFIVSKKGIAESLSAGATAVLLTAKIGKGAQLSKLVEECEKRQISPFIEIESTADLDGVDISENTIIAVNNRNIEDREVTGEGITRSLFQIIGLRERFGYDQCIVSASGISSRKSGDQVLSSGFDAILVGTSLLCAPNLQLNLRQYKGFGAIHNVDMRQELL